MDFGCRQIGFCFSTLCASALKRVLDKGTRSNSIQLRNSVLLTDDGCVFQTYSLCIQEIFHTEIALTVGFVAKSCVTSALRGTIVLLSTHLHKKKPNGEHNSIRIDSDK
jgi:hypothetical protein